MLIRHLNRNIENVAEYASLNYPAQQLLFIMTSKNSSGDGFQKAISYTSNREWNRIMQNEVWGDWYEIATIDAVTYDSQVYPATEWAPGMTSVDVTSIMSAKTKPGYNKFPIAYTLSQNNLQVSFSPIQDGNYYMNVYNGYTGPLTSSIEIEFIYIKHR